MRKVLLVDDNEPVLKALTRDFTRQGLDVLRAQTAAEAREIVTKHRPQLAVVDLFLAAPENGLQLVVELKAMQPDMFCILMSAHMTVSYAVGAIKAGADDVIQKPFSAKQVLHRLTDGPPPPDMEIPTLDEIEWEHIARVLHDYDGNITHAAEALGVYRQSLQRKIHKHAPRVLHPGELPQTTRTSRRRPPT